MSFTVYPDGSGITTGGPAGIAYTAYRDGEAVAEGSRPLRDRMNHHQAEILAAAFALNSLPHGCRVLEG